MTREEVIRLAKEAGISKAFVCGNPDACPEDDGCCHNNKHDGYWVRDEQLATFAELVAAEYKQDAERYRWLREQNATLEDRTFYVGVDARSEPEGIMWVGSDLDSAIDAAMEKVK